MQAKDSNQNKTDSAAEIQEMRERLAEAQETLRAIQHGEVDALIVTTPQGEQVFAITGAEKPYRLLIEEMKEGAVILSDDNTIVYCNAGFAKMVKRPLDKLIGSNIQNLIAPTHMKDFEELLSWGRTGKGALTKEVTLKANGDAFVPTQMSINCLSMDNLKTTFLVVTDLTQHMEEDLKRYTAELERSGFLLWESEQRWATTLSSIGDAVIATDVEGKVTFMNATAQELTGWTISEALYKPIKQIFHIINEYTRLEVKNPVVKVFEKGVIVGLANHTILVRKDKKEIPLDDSGAPIKNKEGKIVGAVVIFRDITQRRQLEHQLEQYTKNLEALVTERTKKLKDAERLPAIGATAGMVGHDIRNPLQTITGELYLTKCELSNLPESDTKTCLKESLDAIDAQTAYVSKIVADLQDFAKPLTPKIEEADCTAIIQAAFATLKVPENVVVEYIVEKDLPKLKVDPTYMQRILTNLANNAIQAMPNGGKLILIAKRNNGKALIAVEDTGEGIPEHIKDKLFMPLITSKAKGQGFGLAVVKRFTDALGGTISFESEAQKGTKFVLQLPHS